ncbi:MAG: class I SAM-dependent methyltransferase, partial [Kofleriaceae bacterium]
MSGDLSVTALYTSQVWAWGGLPEADLLATPDGKRVFDVTNLALGLARLARPDLPALRYALLHRHAMIDHLLAETTGSVVELAAGLSRRGAANCATRAYTELDLPAVIARKRELLARTARGREALERLTLIAGDVTTAELPAGDLVIAEGLMMYLDGDARRRLFAKVAAHAPRFIFD